MKCVICNKEYEGYGNNAEPIAKGMCCDNCNITYVIPARLKQLRVENKLNDSTLQECRDGDTQLRRFTGNLIREEVNAVEQYDDTMRENKLTPEQQTTLEEIRNDEIDHTNKLNNIYQGLKEGAIEDSKVYHITKEQWDKIPSDYKMVDPQTKEKKVFAAFIYPNGGTTLLTEGKHFIIDESNLEESFAGKYDPADVNEPLDNYPMQDGIYSTLWGAIESVGRNLSKGRRFSGKDLEDSNNLEESAFDIGTFNSGQSGDVSQKENEEMVENMRDAALTENDIYEALEQVYKGSELGTLSVANIMTTVNRVTGRTPERKLAEKVYNDIQNSVYDSALKDDVQEVQPTLEENEISNSVEDTKCKDANIHFDDLRRFCIRHDYYTHGSISDYNNLFTNCEKWTLEEIAMDIAEHSAGVLASEVLANLKREFKNAVRDSIQDDLDRDIYEGWTPRDFINELEPQFKYAVDRFNSKDDVKEWCMSNQPYYKKYVPEVVSYFVKKWESAKNNSLYDNDEVYGDGEEVEEQIEELNENTVEARDSKDYSQYVGRNLYEVAKELGITGWNRMEDSFTYTFYNGNQSIEFETDGRGTIKGVKTNVKDCNTVMDGETFTDYYKAKKRAEQLGLKEAEYGDLSNGTAYCYWNKSGDRDDDAEVYVEYRWGKDGKPIPLHDSDTVNDIGMYSVGDKYRWEEKYGNAQLTLMCVCEDDTIKLSLDNADMYVKIPREKFEGMLRDGIIVATDTLRIDGYDRIKTKDSKFSVKVAGRRFIVKAKDSKTARDKVRKMLRGA